MKIIYITPHLSTGGMPQYLLNQINLLIEDNQIWVIELVSEMEYRIQRDKIESIIGKNLIPVYKNYKKMLQIIKDINPDILHFCELSDYHVPDPILDEIYIPNRKWKIFEIFHDSSIEAREKKYLPDKLLVVSPWQHKLMMELGVPVEIIQNDIKTGVRNRGVMLELGMDPDKKHVMQLGIFSSRKNQSETFSMARLMPDVQFHFVGGQTENYKYYWEPILKNIPNNCKIWGERSDVDKFYQCVDAVVFPSRGQYGDRETSPLVIRESVAWKVPILMRNLPIYMDSYRESVDIKFMSDNISENVDYLYNLLKIKKQTMNKNEITIPEYVNISQENIDSFFTDYENVNKVEDDSIFFKKKLFNIKFESSENKLVFDYLEDRSFLCDVCVKDIDSEVTIYSFDAHFCNKNSYWSVPIPKAYYDFSGNKNFGGFLFDFYDKNGVNVYKSTLRMKSIPIKKIKYGVHSMDPLFVNYEQFFTDRIYDGFFSKINNLNLVVDVGSNVGLFTELVLTRGANQVISLEINKKAIKTFKERYENDSRVKLIEKGLGYVSGISEIYIDPNNSLVSSILPNHTTNLIHKEKIDIISFSDLVKSENLQKIDLIKIDVEGSEYGIFNGMTEEDMNKIENILLEFHDNFGNILEDSILSKLREFGFTYSIFQDNCVDEGFDYEERGTIFAQKEIISEIISENIEKQDITCENFIDRVDIGLPGIYGDPFEWRGHFAVEYRGASFLKCPFDYVLYQMLIMSVKPDLIIEIGTSRGGGAYYYGDLLEILGGNREVHTINIYNEVELDEIKNHKRIKFFYNGWENYDLKLTEGFNKILVIDDGTHDYDSVLGSLNKFSPIVSEGSYFIIEDGIITELNLDGFNGGPLRAIKEFLYKNDNFKIDRYYCDFFGTNATFNPNGYLKKIK